MDVCVREQAKLRETRSISNAKEAAKSVMHQQIHIKRIVCSWDCGFSRFTQETGVSGDTLFLSANHHTPELTHEYPRHGVYVQPKLRSVRAFPVVRRVYFRHGNRIWLSSESARRLLSSRIFIVPHFLSVRSSIMFFCSSSFLH